LTATPPLQQRPIQIRKNLKEDAMQIEQKSIPATTMLESVARLKLADICGHTAPIITELMAEAEARGGVRLLPASASNHGLNG